MPAIKSLAPDGSVLLRPLAVNPTPASRQSFVTVTLVEGVTVQLAAEPTARPREPDVPHNGGSAQCSPFIIGPRKQACIGNKLKF